MVRDKWLKLLGVTCLSYPFTFLIAILVGIVFLGIVHFSWSPTTVEIFAQPLAGDMLQLALDVPPISDAQSRCTAD